MFAVLSGHPDLPFGGGGRLYLLGGCAIWVLGATFRVARFNLNADVLRVRGLVMLFLGIRTTVAAGLLVTWLLLVLKYEPASSPFHSAGTSGVRLVSGFTTPIGVWRAMPIVMALGGLAMASNLRMPKLGKSRSRAFTVFILANLAIGVPLAFARRFPELLVLQPSAWVIVFLVWGLISREARAMRPPRIFAPRPPPEQPDDLLE
jgi:phosphatidylserine synthase